MKELSIEQKAKAYDEALEKAKEYYKDCKQRGNLWFVEDMEDMFPELAESEEERIRKELIAMVKLSCTNGEDVDKKIAWLEKQGETVEINPTEFDLRLNKLLKQFETLPKEELASSLSFYLNVVQNGTYKEEKQGEQKPVQEIELAPIFKIGDILKRKGKDYTFRVDRIQGGYYHCDRNNGAFFPIEEQDNWELVEQNLPWSEEDKRMLGKCIDAASGYYLPEDKQNMKDWLKSLKNRVQMQSKQEWSEKDEEMHRKCICAMRASACGFPEEEKFVEQVDNWLKLLKDRVQPQPKQEWSKEDKDMINTIISDLKRHGGDTTYSAEVDWLEQFQPKQEWSKEDEGYFNNIAHALSVLLVDPYYDEIKLEHIGWFNSIKNRYTWKPSDEQMDVLETAVSSLQSTALESLYNDLNKL